MLNYADFSSEVLLTSFKQPEIKKPITCRVYAGYNKITCKECHRLNTCHTLNTY